MKFLYLLIAIISVQVFSSDETKDKLISNVPERILL